MVQMSERRCVLARQPQKAVISKYPKPLLCPAAGNLVITPTNSTESSIEYLKALLIYVCKCQSRQRDICKYTTIHAARIPQPRHQPNKTLTRKKKRGHDYQSKLSILASSDRVINYRKRTPHTRESLWGKTPVAHQISPHFLLSFSFQTPRPHGET